MAGREVLLAHPGPDASALSLLSELDRKDDRACANSRATNPGLSDHQGEIGPAPRPEPLKFQCADRLPREANCVDPGAGRDDMPAKPDHQPLGRPSAPVFEVAPRLRMIEPAAPSASADLLNCLDSPQADGYAA